MEDHAGVVENAVAEIAVGGETRVIGVINVVSA